MDNRWQAVIASSDIESRRRIGQMLNNIGVDSIICPTVSQFREIPERENVGQVFCDRSLVDGTYQDVLTAAAFKWNRKRVPVVLISSTINPTEYQSAKRSGLFESIASPCRPTDLEWMVILAKREERTRFKPLVGRRSS